MRLRPDAPPLRRSRSARPARAAGAALLIGLLPTAVSAIAPSPAGAQALCGTSLGTSPTLTVDRSVLPAAATSTVTVTGTGYLTGRYPCDKQLFGGVYVFFGWVAPGDRWGPSHRSSADSSGQFGITYSYPGEGGGGDTRDDGSGAVRLISFTAGGTSGSDTAFHMDAAGNFSTTIGVRGALYRWTDVATGATNTVDCRAVQCGIMTMGAHGKASATNERFTPISFRDEGTPPTIPTGGVSATPAPKSTTASPSAPRPTGGGATGATRPSATLPAGSGSGTGSPSAAEPGPPTITVAPPSETPSEVAPDTSTAPADHRATRGEIVAGQVVRVRTFSGADGPAPLGVVLALAVATIGAVAAWFVRNRFRSGREA